AARLFFVESYVGAADASNELDRNFLLRNGLENRVDIEEAGSRLHLVAEPLGLSDRHVILLGWLEFVFSPDAQVFPKHQVRSEPHNEGTQSFGLYAVCTCGGTA